MNNKKIVKGLIKEADYQYEIGRNKDGKIVDIRFNPEFERERKLDREKGYSALGGAAGAVAGYGLGNKYLKDPMAISLGGIGGGIAGAGAGLAYAKKTNQKAMDKLKEKIRAKKKSRG